MNCSFEFEKSTKLIKISADTECYWTIMVQSGNITLHKYYGSLNKGNNFLAQTAIFTYGTSEMNGELLCTFQSNNKIVKKKMSLESIPLDFLYVLEKEVYLFGQTTKTQLYVNYGSALKDNESSLSNITISINDSEIIYNGTYFQGEVQYKNIDLFEYEISEYNENGQYFVITLKSLCNLEFNDSIVIDDKHEIIIRQKLVENLPSLLKISPCIIFLDSNNPKQKINVTSMASGMTATYEIANSMADTQSYNFLQENLTTEEYLNSVLTPPMSIVNSNTNIIDYISEKNASHFIIDMGSSEQNMETTGETGYELYVYNTKDKSKFQKLEIFYDHIEDPNNHIYITSVKNAYAYTYIDNNEEEMQIKWAENGVIDFADALSGQSYVTLFFTKNILTDSTDIKNMVKDADVILAQYNMNENIIFTIDSKPDWWRIVDSSDNVKEVKLSNKELHISLETEIFDYDHVKLENELGRTCTIVLKNEAGVLNIANDIFAFEKSETNDDGVVNITLEPFITIEISGDSINKIDNQENKDGKNYFTLKSQFSNEKVFTFDTTYEKTDGKTIELPTIFYKKNDKEIDKIIENYNFEILYNNEIDKYYINYGSFTILPNDSLLDMKDGNKYYFDGNKITIPRPYSTIYAPFTFVDIDNIAYDIYTWNGKQYEKITYYIPESDTTNIGYSIAVPKNKLDEVDIVLVSNTMLIEKGYENAINFQQLLTMKEVSLVIKTSAKQQNNYINKYGNVQDLKQMQLINFPSLSGAVNASNAVSISVPQDDEKKLYYASYKKESSFKVAENPNVNFYIVKNATITNVYSEDLLNEGLEGGGNENMGDFYNQMYSGTTSDFTQLTSGTPIKYNENTYYHWEIKNGLINLSIKDGDGLKCLKSIFPETGITKSYINDTFKDGGENVNSPSLTSNGIAGFVIKDNDAQTYYAIKYGTSHKISLNNKKYEIKKYDDNDQYYIEYNCLYRLCDKTIDLNNQTYQFDTMNALYDPRTKIKYYAHEEDKKWYFVLPNFEFDINYDSTNKKFYYVFQGTKVNINNNLTHIYDDTKYFASMKVNLSGLTLEVLSNLDGNGRINKEYFVIINDKKYHAYQDENEEWYIKLINNKKIKLDIENLTITFDEDFYVDLISEADYDYVIVDQTQYQLIDNILIYDSKEYFPFTWNGQKYVIINNKGYKVYKENEHYYFILNYIKYEYKTYSTNEIKVFNIPSTTNNTTVLNVEELINQQFHFELQFEDLLANDIISAKYNDYVVTNGYCTILSEDKYFKSGSKPIEKYIWIDEDESYDVIAEEIIKMKRKNTSQETSSISLTFNDETSLTFQNNCEVNLSINNTIETKTIDKNQMFVVNSGTTLTFNSVTLIINDYSEVVFNNDIFMTFQNDCNIRIENQSYFVNKNETFAVDSGTTIIFKDIVKLKLYTTNSDVDLFIFNDIVNINEQLFIPFEINNQKAIIYNNNTYYIYDGKVTINNQPYNTEKCVFYKNINTNGLSFVSYKIESFKEGETEIKYGYISGNTLCPMKSLSDVSTWQISVPTFNEIKNLLKIQKYNLQNIVTYNITDDNKIKYYKAEFTGHTNYNNEPIYIENGIFDLNINSYRLYDDENNTSGYTSSQKQYQITLNESIYSVWDYFAQDYVKKIKIIEYNSLNCPIVKKINLNNVKFTVDEKKYFLINDKFIKIQMDKEIPYIKWEGESYNVYNDEVTIPQKCNAYPITDGYTICFDINSYLTHNMIINFYNDDLGHVHYFTVQNALSIPHTENIIIETQDMDDKNKFLYGKYNISLY